jgi:hypothetical protein
MYGSPNPLIGKTVTAVHLADDGGAIKFTLADGKEIMARADGDCCSHSWIEAVDLPVFLLGTVATVEDLFFGSEDSEEFDCLKKYGCKITTDKGTSVIDFRNSSNGYYGGELVWDDPDDGRFYGGVYGQNRSSLKWKQIV